MGEPNLPLLKANLKQLRRPTILAECEKLAREATESTQTYEEYFLRLTVRTIQTRHSTRPTTAVRGFLCNDDGFHAGSKSPLDILVSHSLQNRSVVLLCHESFGGLVLDIVNCPLTKKIEFARIDKDINYPLQLGDKLCKPLSAILG